MAKGIHISQFPPRLYVGNILGSCKESNTVSLVLSIALTASLLRVFFIPFFFISLFYKEIVIRIFSEVSWWYLGRFLLCVVWALDSSILLIATNSYLSVEGLKCLCLTHGVHRFFVCCFLVKCKKMQCVRPEAFPIVACHPSPGLPTSKSKYPSVLDCIPPLANLILHLFVPLFIWFSVTPVFKSLSA